MSDYSFLFTLAAPPVGSIADELVVCDAQYMIPVFWYALFDETCVQTATVETEDGETFRYPRLMTQTPDGLQRAGRREGVLVETIGGNSGELFAAFTAHLRSVDRGFVCCETLEWWEYFGADERFREHLATCLRAFDVPAFERRGFFKRLVLRPEWDELFGQANFTLKGSGLPPALSLCGSTLTEPVPWPT